MITQLRIEGFRSIEKETVKLGPLTVLYGPTASGKSSLMYALLVLRNFLLNPNQTSDAFFNLQFISLGGFEDCVFNHDKSRRVVLWAESADDDRQGSYELALGKTDAQVKLHAERLPEMQGKLSIPYALNQNFPVKYTDGKDEFDINWNAVGCTVSPKEPNTQTQSSAHRIGLRLNGITERLKAVDIAPNRRGFFKGSYTPVSISTSPYTEDEVATTIINDPNMAGRISVYAEEIFQRDFRLYTPPGTATVFLQTTDKKARIPGLLVNDGFGINQVVYLLAKMLRPETRTLLIEEPEVHLHPTVLRNFARELCKFVREEKKQVLLASHSEQLVAAILATVAQGQYDPSDVCFYLVRKENRSTSFTSQAVSAEGQVQGGLSTFIEAELDDIQKMIRGK